MMAVLGAGLAFIAIALLAIAFALYDVASAIRSTDRRLRESPIDPGFIRPRSHVRHKEPVA